MTIRVSRTRKEEMKFGEVVSKSMSGSPGKTVFLWVEVSDFLRSNPDVVEWLQYFQQIEVEIPSTCYGFNRSI